MSLLVTVFDAALVLAIFWLAWRSLAADDLFSGIVHFISFGVLMAVAWMRLRAPDIALAEITVGSGVTGALLLSALARSRRVAANWSAGQSSGEAQRNESTPPANS